MLKRVVQVPVLAALLAVSVLVSRPAMAAPTGLRVGIYVSTGAESDKILALFRAVAAAGHVPKGIGHYDILRGRLSTSNFDVFILPAGEDGKRCCAGHYSDDGDALGGIPAQSAIRSFLNAGGGMVAIEAGAYFASSNGGTLDVYSGSYTNVTNQIGKKTVTLVDPAFGSGTVDAWQSYGGGYFSVASGATVVANNASGQPVIVRTTYGPGRLVLAAHDLELRGDSELDWTLWDNWAMGGVHTNSVKNWELLGRMIGWAYKGDASAPVISAANPTGSRVAIVTTHTTDGGAWAGLLPAVARATEYAGHIPLAIRLQEIKDGRLTLSNFKVVTFPGGYSYGYKVGLSGYEQKVRDFVSAGGSYYGICAGGFYAAQTVNWLGKAYAYPLALLASTDTGSIDDIIPYPQYALTPILINDPVIGTGSMQQLYYGGGYFTLPSDTQQGAHVFAVGTYDYSGTRHGQADLIRFAYGSGRVLITGTHPESREGSNDDWLFWNDFAYDSDTPLSNPDNSWTFVNAAFDNWLTLP